MMGLQQMQTRLDEDEDRNDRMETTLRRRLREAQDSFQQQQQTLDVLRNDVGYLERQIDRFNDRINDGSLRVSLMPQFLSISNYYLQDRIGKKLFS